MSSITALPHATPLPEGPRLAVDRYLQILVNSKGFEDRIYAANNLVELVSSLAFAGVIDADQNAAVLRRLRLALQSDLGTIGGSEQFNVFEISARDARSPE